MSHMEDQPDRGDPTCLPLRCKPTGMSPGQAMAGVALGVLALLLALVGFAVAWHGD